MNHRLLPTLLATLLPALSDAAPDWENEAVFRINQEAPRATSRPLDIELARHPVDLRKSERITVNIDFGPSGLGGTNSWGQLPLEKYRLSGDKAYAYAFRTIPGK